MNSYLTSERLLIINAPFQTPLAEHVQLYLGHIRPTAVRRCLVKLKASSHKPSFRRLVRLMQRAKLSGVTASDC